MNSQNITPLNKMSIRENESKCRYEENKTVKQK